MVEMAIGNHVLSNLVGYRFHPTDQQIVSFFLKNKMLGNDHLVQAIPEVDICKHDPWELPNFSVLESDDPEWFFFSALDLKHNNGRRLNRKTRTGFWKPTGKDRKIEEKKTKKLIGTKKTLVFHKGRVPNAIRTNWVIHEYHSVENHPQKTMYVVCLLKKKDDDKVDKLADDNPDCDLRSTQTNRAIPEVLPAEENGDFPFTLPWEEANCELPFPGDHLDWEVDGLALADSFIVDPYENDLEFGDLPPNPSQTGECSNWSFQPQSRMLRNGGGSTLQSHFRYVEQGNIYRCIEFSGQDSSGRAVSKVRLKRRIGNENTAGNPIKAEESSKCTRNHRPSKNGAGTRSPLEYCANVIVGIVLLIAFVREMVLYGEWGM